MRTQKDKLHVILYTTLHKIKGEMHLYENSRLTDILNADTSTKDFLPLTGARIYDMKESLLQEVDFLTINKKMILMVLEDDEANALVRARELVARRKYAEALIQARKAAKALPRDPEAQYLVGFCMARQGDTAGAKAAFDACLKLSPDVELAQKARELLSGLK